MNPELLAKIQAAYNSVNHKRAEDKKVKESIKKEKRAKLYGDAGIKVFHTDSGRLAAVVPIGMTTVKFTQVCTKKAEKIEEFKHNMDNNMLLL